MPVNRCPDCGRGLAGYLDGEKELSDMTADEIRSEILKYEAKERRIRTHMTHLATCAPQDYHDGTACTHCEQGWREFQNHRKDLEQLTMEETRSALGANTRYLKALRDRFPNKAAQS